LYCSLMLEATASSGLTIFPKTLDWGFDFDAVFV